MSREANARVLKNNRLWKEILQPMTIKHFELNNIIYAFPLDWRQNIRQNPNNLSNQIGNNSNGWENKALLLSLEYIFAKHPI